jgi:glycosyltransferase involved in cell wall biosynthesis
VFLGNDDYFNEPKIKEIIKNFHLEEVVKIKGFVPYNQCLKIMASSSILLLLQGGEDTNNLVPAKLFEYLRIGRPILALTDFDSTTSEIMHQLDAGSVAPLGDSGRIKKALTKMFEDRNRWENKPRVGQSEINVFKRENLTGQLADILNKITDISSSDALRLGTTAKQGEYP